MKRSHTLVVAALLAPGLLAGCSSLGSAGPSPQQTATVTVTETPAAAQISEECNAALDQADAAISADSALAEDVPQVLSALQEAVAAAGRMDVNGVTEQTRVLEGMDLQTKATQAQDAARKYQEAVAKCRELRQ
ncbi:outer membrane murein-binding lipoprotein Lpp [Kineosphaera limosa]|uniref:Lipoprotein n=1 Tax=Kineosphaera limosa NBRC 100340 TaxID=1184609 RepID=K6WQZ6_9MICO|nr:hypothetical protein [Kineosphaera limosa]NYE03190.1 outer membrane murein-binding lipoprotein Lpp [Kineosphaera limosa]GAB94527.1 hypothetical protein KILIM_005_01440 [Kineosphaera limosa NBRC 100340]